MSDDIAPEQHTVPGKDAVPAAGAERIDATFRNGSLTAISVVVGFSLSFLNRWAGLPGAWHADDLAAVAFITVGIVAQIIALARMLFVSSLVRSRYESNLRIFLFGLALVALGVGIAILGDIVGFEQNALRG
jgi:hypothetical protein